MAEIKTDNLYKWGDFTLRNLAKQPLPTEKLEAKWSEVKDRPTPTNDELEKLRMLDERWGIAKNAKQRIHDKWNQSYLQYRSINHFSALYGMWPTYWNTWGSAVFIPRTFETIESVKVQMMGRKPSFTVKPAFPRSSGDGKEIHYLTHAEYNRSNSHEEVTETVHDALLYGSGIVRSDLKNERKKETVMSWGEDGSIIYTPQVVTKYFGVGCRRVDPYDWFPNPSIEAYKREKMGWGFERSVVDAWDLREEYRLLKEAGAIGVTDNWQYIRPGGDVSNHKYIREEIDSLYSMRLDARTPGNVNDLFGNVSSFSHATTTPNKGKIEVLEYWEDDRWIVVANGLILRVSPNPYPHKKIPYIKFDCVEMNEPWGMGIPEYIRWLQVTENILYDQGLNNIIMSVHKMFAVNSRYLEDEGELVARPFGIIHLKQTPGVKISDAIMPIEYSHQMGNYFEFMRKNTENIQTVTGVSAYQTGGVTKESKVERATVANRLTFAGSARIREIARHLEDRLVKSLIEDYVAIIQFYYRNLEALGGQLPLEIEDPAGSFSMLYLPKTADEITSDELEQATQKGYKGVIAQDMIQGRVKVVVEGGSTLPTDPDEKARLKLEFLKTAATLARPDGSPVFDVEAVAKDVAREFFEISNPDDYLPQAPPAPVLPPGAEGGGGGLPAVSPPAASPVIPPAPGMSGL